MSGPELARRYAPVAWFGLLVAIITLPWWTRSGYVWLLDSVWGPHQAIGWAHPTMNLAWQVVTAVLTKLFTAPVAEKIVLSGLLWAVGLSGYYLARRLVGPAWALAAGTLYLLNPFVYERLLAGQWIVLAGCALMPLLLGLAWDTLESRGRRSAWRLGALLAVSPLVSPHYAYISAFLLVGLAAVYAGLRPARWLWSRRAGAWVMGVAAAGLATNWVWLVSPGGRFYQAFTALDFTTFRTAADPVVGAWDNVLGLYGFWRGAAFIEPKDLLGPVWLAVAGVIFALAVAGAARAFRTRQPLALTLALAAPVALVLAVGYASPPLRPFIDLLIRYLPGFRGLRDTEKLAGVLALAYAALAPYGAAGLTKRLPHGRRPAALAAPAVLALLAAISVTGFWGGAGRQVPVADYPSGWYAVSARLARTPHATAAILPWHNYLNLGFVDNAYVAQPAAVFFTNPVLSSDEIDNILTARPDTPADRLMLQATTGQITPHAWATRLKALGASYVILEKTDDWPAYAQLVTGAGLKIQYQDSSIELLKL